MKPLHIVLLVLAGALGGAVVMTVAQRAHRTAQAPATSRTAQTSHPPAPAPAVAPPTAEPAPEPTAPPAVTPVEMEKPSPLPERTEAPRKVQKPARPRRVEPPANPRPIVVAQNAPPSSPPAMANPEPVSTTPPAALPAETPAAVAVTPARPEPEPATPAPPPPPNRVTLNTGTIIPVRLIDGLSSERNNPGYEFTATLDKELVVDGFVIAERGARVEGRVVASDRGGKVKGVAALAVELTRIHTSDGQAVTIQTDSFEKHAEQSQRQDAEKIGIGAAVGAAIGAIAGGGKGAAVGAGVGGGAGAGDVLLTRGKPATLPSETRINFRLRAPVTITERKG